MTSQTQGGSAPRDLAKTETACGFDGGSGCGGMSGRFGGARFRELGPAGTDHAIGIFGGHLDDAVLSDGDTPAG
jgi:hypothetical protein